MFSMTALTSACDLDPFNCKMYLMIFQFRHFARRKTLIYCYFNDHYDTPYHTVSRNNIPMSLFLNTRCKGIYRMAHVHSTSRQQYEVPLSFNHCYFPDNQSQDDGRSGGKTSAWTPTCSCTTTCTDNRWTLVSWKIPSSILLLAVLPPL